MSVSQAKKQTLEECGYEYRSLRMIYVNQATKKIFSYEAIDDNEEQWLKDCIEAENFGDWQFYFNNPQPADELKQEIINELEG